MNPLSYLLLAVFLVLPLVITLYNLVSVFTKGRRGQYVFGWMTMVLGPLFSLILLTMEGAPPDYPDPVVLGGVGPSFHTPIASWYLPSFLAFAVIGIAAYLLLLHGKDRLPPLIAVVGITGVYIGAVVSVLYIAQLAKNLGLDDWIEVLFLILFPFNYLLCAAKVLRQTIRGYVRDMSADPPIYESLLRDSQKKSDSLPAHTNPFLNFCWRTLSRSAGWLLLPFLFMLPLLAALLGILLLFGQQPDSLIRAFTQTSDWTLSQQISPPPVTVDSHYLCTVALRGHRRLVRPTRCGLRRGKKIVVNRQLCVANAFEQCVMEKCPRLHRKIRDFYDRRGYPLSRHITTPLRADIVYILMKPLEWLFLLFLYAADRRPESRIARQYLPVSVQSSDA